jgi:hypothetical protein
MRGRVDDGMALRHSTQLQAVETQVHGSSCAAPPDQVVEHSPFDDYRHLRCCDRVGRIVGRARP